MKVKFVVFFVLLISVTVSQNKLGNNNYISESGINLVYSDMYGIGYRYSINDNSSIRGVFYYNYNDWDERNITSINLGNGQYNEWQRSLDNHKFAIEVDYLRDVYKFNSSKFYIGLGIEYKYSESNSETERILEIENQDLTSSKMYPEWTDKTFTLLGIIGYEKQIYGSIKLFGELSYNFKWNYEREEIKNGWSRYSIDTEDLRINGLSEPTELRSNNFSDSSELSAKLGLIFTF